MTTPTGVVAELSRMDTSGIEAPTNPLPQPERSAQILAPTHEAMRPLGRASPVLELCSRPRAREVGRTRFEADYQYRAQEIFNRIDAKYKQLNQDYDEDTGHMTNRVQQVSWDKYFQKRLDFMPPTDEG